MTIGSSDRVKMRSSRRARSFEYEGAGATFTNSPRGPLGTSSCAVSGCGRVVTPPDSDSGDRGFDYRHPDTAHEDSDLVSVVSTADCGSAGEEFESPSRDQSGSVGKRRNHPTFNRAS